MPLDAHRNDVDFRNEVDISEVHYLKLKENYTGKSMGIRPDAATFPIYHSPKTLSTHGI